MDLKRTSRKGILTLLVLIISVCALPAYADSINLITNGSFENPVVSADSTCGTYANCVGFHNAVAGNDNIGGWQLIGKGGVDINNVPISGAPATMLLLGLNYTEPDTFSGQTLFFHPEDGLQSLDLTGEGNQGTTNGVKQSIVTNTGSLYSLSFWYGHQYSSAPGYTGLSALALYIDGNLIDSFGTSQNTLDDVSWSEFGRTFTASSSQTTIAFLNDAPVGNNFAGLDNV